MKKTSHKDTKAQRKDRRTAAPKFSGVKWTQIYADRVATRGALPRFLRRRLSRTVENKCEPDRGGQPISRDLYDVPLCI